MKIKTLLFLFFLWCLPLYAQESRAMAPFTQKDRILILAPHPDDEVLGAAGVIQEALRLKIPVKIVYLSHGDNNEVSFIIYEKRLVILKKAFIAMGEVRRKEAVAAMKFLGIPENQLVFLGYPDFGTLEIFTKYWNTGKPYRSMLTRVTEVPYAECLSPHAPYRGESVLKDLERVILDFKPTKIFVSHSVDVNRDHRALNLFLQVVLWDLKGQIRQPEIFPYLIHAVGWPRPKGYHPELRLTPPKNLDDSQLAWQILDLTDAEVERKKEALTLYKSQVECCLSYLSSFVRKNELFGGYPTLQLFKPKNAEILWEDVKTSKGEDEADEQNTGISKLAYAQQGGYLLIRLGLKHRIDKQFGISVYLFGYSKNKSFPLMSKIHLTIGLGGVRLKDKKRPLSSKVVQVAYQGKSMILKVPFSLLDNPQYLLASAASKAKDLPFDNTAWRILEIE
jgi:LmbE family N-acetylglucosaminyl deacetylase